MSHLLLRQIHHQYSKFMTSKPQFQYLHTMPPHLPATTTHRTAISNEVITILDTINPMEAALEHVLPYLSPDIITSVIQQHPNPLLGFRFFVWAMNHKRLRCWESHNLVISMLVKDNGFDLFWKTLEEIKSFEIPVASHAFSVLIAAYSKMGMAEKAVESFAKMKEFNCKPDVFTYNSVLHVMLEKEVFLLALAVYNQMVKLNCNPNQSTYSILINGLCKSGKTEDALQLFDEMTQREILPNVMTYTIIVLGLCRAKRTDDAYKLLNRMKQSGCRPDSITYNALLDGFCKVGRVDEALQLLQTFKKDGYVLGINGYSCLIDGLFGSKRYDEAYKWYMNMFVEGIKPDVVLYTIMIRGISQAGNVKDALNLLREMTERGLVPDTYCYNAVINGFCDMGLLDKARSLQLEISKNDCFPNTCTYTILICGMCKNGLVGEARQIFSEMEKLGCFPSVVTFNALIDGLCKADQLEEAQLLLYKMEIGRNPSLFLRLSQGTDRVLDSASLQAMVERLCESGLILKAYKLLMQLADSGVIPNITTYNTLINGMCKAENINGAFKLFKELQIKGHSPDSVTYGTLIDGLFRVDREGDAFAIFDQMLKSGCRPSSAVYKSLMTWSCRRKKVSLAFALWLKYLRNLPSRESQTIRLVEESFKRGDVERAVRELIEMDLKLQDFDLAPYTIWLIGFCQIGKLEEALKIFFVLEEFKINVTPPSCVNLIHNLCKEGNLNLAIDIFNYTLEKGTMLMPRISNQLLTCLLRSQDKLEHAHDLLSRMTSVGYDLDTYLNPSTKSLLQVALSWHT